VLSAPVVPKAENYGEILDRLQTLGREVAVKNPQSILEGFEPSFDIIALPTAHHDVLEPEPPRRPTIPWATVSGDDRLSLAVAEAVLQKFQCIDALSISRGEHAHDLAVFGVYCRKIVDPAIFRSDLRFVDDEASPSLTLD